MTIATVLEDPRGQGHFLEDFVTAYGHNYNCSHRAEKVAMCIYICRRVSE